MRRDPSRRRGRTRSESAPDPVVRVEEPAVIIRDEFAVEGAVTVFRNHGRRSDDRSGGDDGSCGDDGGCGNDRSRSDDRSRGNDRSRSDDRGCGDDGGCGDDRGCGDDLRRDYTFTWRYDDRSRARFDDRAYQIV